MSAIKLCFKRFPFLLDFQTKSQLTWPFASASLPYVISSHLAEMFDCCFYLSTLLILPNNLRFI
jgi:hypothetical protein